MSGDRQIAADTAARESALDVSRSFIVQAPAGSGKTELLIQRYLRLLAVVEEPEQVLAITFTRKAAQEMQLRVIAALQRARDGDEPEPAHERVTYASAAAVLDRSAARDWQIVDSPARLRIETVDAFGAGIARTLPLSAGLGSTARIPADADLDEVYERAAAATLDYLVEDTRYGSVVERVLRHVDNHTGVYLGYLASMLRSREQWLAITGGGGVDAVDADAMRDELQGNIATLIERQLADVCALAPDKLRKELPAHARYAARNLLDAKMAEPRHLALLDMDALPGGHIADRDAWRALADLLLTGTGTWRKQLNRNQGFPPGDQGEKKAMTELIASLADEVALRNALLRVRTLPDAHYSDDQWQVLLALFELLPLAAAELRRLFSERGVTDHAQVAEAAAAAVGTDEAPGDITMLLDYRIRHLLVDEMQDTSITQYEFLRNLTAGWTGDDGRTIFCVGDPMQSIYRFREAEVGEFLLARQKGIGNVHLEPLVLRRNFRSGENLVHWFNTVFAQVLAPADDIASGAIAYEESVPVDAHTGDGRVELHPLFDADAEEEARCTLDVLKALLGNSEDQVAVLVRSRTHLSDLLKLMREADIDYQAVEIDRVTDLPEIVDLLALTRALCHDGDRLAWLALLRGPWTGLRWRDLKRLVGDDTSGTVVEICTRQGALDRLDDDAAERVRATLQLLAEFRGTRGVRSLRERVEAAWFALGGPALIDTAEALDNVYRYLDILDSTGSAGTLADITLLEQRLDAERVSGARSNARVQVMTMHKAKGLEFDHVVLHGLGRSTRGERKAVLRWLHLPDESGRGDMVVSPVGSRTALDNDPLHQFIECIEKDKSKLELDRLLYVACTRARHSLHLVGSVGVSNDGESCGPPNAGSLLRRLWVAVEPVYANAFERIDNLESRSDDAGDDSLLAPPLHRFVAPWQSPAPPPMPSPSRAEASQSDREVEFYWVGTAARHAGTIVHRWLKRISDGRLDPRSISVENLRAPSDRWARELGVGDDQVRAVVDRASRALLSMLEDERGRWLLEGEGHAELPVTGLYRGSVESVVIDRVRIDDDGRHWIVDYKTSTHEGGDIEGFLGQEADRYGPQLEKYATLYSALSGAPVRTALYFPLLNEFLEVEC